MAIPSDGTDKALDRIREKLSRAGKTLNPPAREEDVAEFEEEYAIALPPDYRAFILGVGDGGDGPDTALHPLWSGPFDHAEFLSVPGDLTLDYGKVPTAFIRPHDSQAARQSDAVNEVRGLVVLSDDGAGIAKSLCVHGREYGRILRVEGEESQISLSYFDDFLSWYEAWLDDELRGWDTYYHGSYMPGDEEGLIGVATSPAHDRVRQAAILSLDKRIPTLSDATLARLCDLMRDDPVREIRDGASRAVRRRMPVADTGFLSKMFSAARRWFGARR